MSLRVELSYEEKIINALRGVPEGGGLIATMKREFDAIRGVLTPLYAENDRLRERIRQLEGSGSHD